MGFWLLAFIKLLLFVVVVVIIINNNNLLKSKTKPNKKQRKQIEQDFEDVHSGLQNGKADPNLFTC